MNVSMILTYKNVSLKNIDILSFLSVYYYLYRIRAPNTRQVHNISQVNFYHVTLVIIFIPKDRSKYRLSFGIKIMKIRHGLLNEN